SLQPNVWTEAQDDVFMKYEFPVEGPKLEDFTLCYRFQRTLLPAYETHFSYALPNIDNALEFAVEANDGTYGMVMIYNGGYPYGRQFYQPPLGLYTWYHFCHVISSSYLLFLDGKLVFSANWIKGRIPLNMTGTLIIGQEQDAVGSGFSVDEIMRGYVSEFNIWNKVLERDQISKFANQSQ
ncbi:unnamed protein product, partial [Meganyctiphanes norvegica]